MTKPGMVFLIILISFSSISLADWSDNWDKSYIYNVKSQKVNIYTYKTSASDRQVLVLNGATGTITDDGVTLYNEMARLFSDKGMQVVVLSFDYYGTFAHTTRDAAQNVRNTIFNVINAGFVNRGFWLYSTAGGSIMAAAMLDYNLGDYMRYAPLTLVCDRVIFISGPVHGIARDDIANSHITGLMEDKDVESLDSLNTNLSWEERSSVWVDTMRAKDGNGLRFVVSSNDYVYCNTDMQEDGCPPIPSMMEAVDDWIVNATDGNHNVQTLKNLGLLKILNGGGHDYLQTNYQVENTINFVSNNL